ncbi:hypothetical protein OBBRIDRAFT_825108 [Obba rivulosa]|uniref:F-box domain-containing protein n=1 Tax=Obba rivulosa TaxID=1052685 RepID=A0A8E2B3U7_9APHY|nr:hypothetical protein OBBRIDRAFT_825108 [Obba rivulosa]
MSQLPTSYPNKVPIDIWYLILEAIDDPRAFLACGCICRALASIVRRMKDDRKGDILTLDFNALHGRLASDLLIGHFLERVEIYPSMLNKFAGELAGKLHGLKHLTIFHGPESRPLRQLRPFVLIALSKFRSVIDLSLLGVVFATFGDFARVICTFVNLSSATLSHVAWQRGEAFDLLEEPFAKELRLKSVIFSGLNALSQFRHLLSAPCLPNSLTSLNITSEEKLLQEVTDPLSRHLIAHLQSLDVLKLHFQGHDVTPTSMLSTFLLQMPTNCISYVHIEFFDPYGPPRPFRADSDSSRRWFALLDETLASSRRFPCLQCVCISLEFHPEDVAGISGTPFPLLKARGILYLNIEIHASPFEIKRWLQSRESRADGPRGQDGAVGVNANSGRDIGTFTKGVSVPEDKKNGSPDDSTQSDSDAEFTSRIPRDPASDGRACCSIPLGCNGPWSEDEEAMVYMGGMARFSAEVGSKDNAVC